MSFEFPKPVPESIDISPDPVFDKNRYDLMSNPEPDYDELLFRLSIYAFNRLCPGDQRERVEEIRRNVDVVEDVQHLPEESDEAFRLRTFVELFKKLSFSEQRRFLSKVTQKFKREWQLGELMSSFKQLDAEHQQQLIEKIVHVTPENLRNPRETEEDFRLRRFTQLSRDYTDHVYKLVAWKKSNQDEQEETSDNENGSDCFAEFFLGFSIVWFKGQSSSSQDMLIEQLAKGVSGVVIEQRLQEDETEKLRRFTELCKQVVDFGVQEKFLDNAEEKLRTWPLCDRYRLILEPQDSDSAAELLSRLSCFGFSLLSAMYQQKIIDEMSKQVEGVEIETSPAAAAQEGEELEGIRMARFRQLFNQVLGPKRTDIFKHFRSIFNKGHDYPNWIRFFRRLGSKDQAELINNLFNKLMKYQSEEWDSAQLIMEKFWGESEEEFRLRRFENMCIKLLSTFLSKKKLLSTCMDFVKGEDEERVLQLYRTSESDHIYEESCYAEFLFGVSIIWYKTRCANYRRNPVQLILFGEVELGDTIEKLEGESEEDFRLRRFTESFKKLELTSQVRIVDYIQHTLFRDCRNSPVFNENHHKLMSNSEPDYDELLIRLSLYAFNRLSPSDQRQQVEEIRRNVDVEKCPEESDEAFRLRLFAELFKKLNFSDQKKLFLSKVIQKFKHERKLGELVSSFQQLDAKNQQQVIEKIVHVTPENLRNPGETEEDFRLRRFTQLSRDYTDYLYKFVVAWKSDQEQEKTSDNENGSDWKCLFNEFFLGFSIIWFRGQLVSGQDMLIEQLSKEVRGTVVIEEPRLQDDETEEDFKLTRFTELCKKIVDFRVQEKFLNNAEEELNKWGYRLILEPQDSDSAAELLYDLSILGFSLLSAKNQCQKIEEMSKLVGGDGVTIEESTDEEDFRMTRFTKLFNQVSVTTRIDLFKKSRKILLQEKRCSEAVGFFRGLGSEDQTEMIQKLSDEMTKYRRDPAELIIEKFSGESEEDFRLRRFEKVCTKHLSTWDYIRRFEADRERVRQATSDTDEESPYAAFLFDASITWFKARCGNYRKNPIHVILFGQVEFHHVIEKLPEESEEAFRLRRFTESFKQLDFTHQVRIVDYIQDTLFGDLGYPKPKMELRQYSSRRPSEGRGEFDPEWIKMKLPYLQDQGAAAAVTTTRGATATTQAGARGGRGQGPSTSTVR